MYKGSIVALVTPFDEAGGIDFAAVSSLVSFHLDSGTDAFVVGGTTGESVTFRTGEFEALLDAVVGQVSGQVPVIVGTGSACTHHTIENTRVAAAHGADGALVVTPYYNRPTQQGLVEHYRTVADNSDIPVILYNVPSRTSLDMLPETVQELAGHEHIVAIKEAGANVERVEELLRLCGDEITVLSGDDHSCYEAMKLGAVGVISVAANVVPASLKKLCRAVENKDWEVADKENTRLRQLFDLLMVETNPIPVKWALSEMSYCLPLMRLPLTPLARAHHAAMKRCLSGLGVLKP